MKDLDQGKSAGDEPPISQEPTGWRPMSAAPHDGTEILVAFRANDKWQAVVSWQWDHNEHFPWCVRGEPAYRNDHAIGWKPLDEPPKR